MRLLLAGARHYGLALAVTLASSTPAAKASIVFNWPNNGWTAGTPAPGTTVEQQFTSVTPNDITVDINNNGASGSGATWQNNYPQISRNPLTGGFGSTQGLQLYLSAEADTSSYVRTTVTFAIPVINLSFQIWDVDAVPTQFVDKIYNIQALAFGGGTVGPSSVTSTTPGFNTITGSGLSTVVLGTANANNSQNQGSINITFAGPITQFSFDWSNNDAGLITQAVALGPLTYDAVPEVDSAMSIIAVCLSALLLERRRVKRRERCLCFRTNSDTLTG